MRELNESFRIKLNDVKVNYFNEFSTIPYGIYGLDLSFTEFKIMIGLYSVKDILKGKENDKFKRSFIAKHMNMDMSNFNKSFNKLIEKEYLLIDENNELVINHKLIRGLCSNYIKENANHLYGGTKKDLIKIIDEKDREADLRVYNKLKKYIDNGTADDEDKAEFAILSNKLGYSNNNTLENNFNNTKTEDYVTTIRPDSNTINTSDDSIDNHISSNEKETEEDIFGEDGEDGFGEDRNDDIQEVIEDTLNDISKYKNLSSELLDYQVPNYEDTSNDTEVDNKEELKTNKMITQETVDLFNELLLLTEGADINSKKENVKIKISDWKRRNEKNYSSDYYRDIALIQFLKEEIENLKIYDTIPDVEEVKVIEDYSYEETVIRNSNDSYAEALKILINRYSNDELNEEEITKEYNSFFGVFYEKKSLNDVLFVYEQVRSKYNKKVA